MNGKETLPDDGRACLGGRKHSFPASASRVQQPFDALRLTSQLQEKGSSLSDIPALNTGDNPSTYVNITLQLKVSLPPISDTLTALHLDLV